MDFQERTGGYMTQKVVKNPDASAPLVIPIAVLRNTKRSRIDDNVRTNSARPVTWLTLEAAHQRDAVLVGGGASAAAHVEDIRQRQRDGAFVFAMNGASRWLREQGVIPNAQVMVDARPDSIPLLDRGVRHILASQVDPALFDMANEPVMFHIAMDGIWELFPQDHPASVPLLGGGASVGMTAMCVAHVMGYRTLHCYGYDSSHAGRASHAYPQPMNDVIPTVDTEWAGQVYTSSVAMKAQAEWFMLLARQLRDQGTAVHVHGQGLLPAMYNTPYEHLSERDKYRLMWQFDLYRVNSPGEERVGLFLEVAQPDGMVIDFGCGTGRAARAIAEAGVPVFLTDFAENCRDVETLTLPFLEWDLTEPCPIMLSAPYGYCTDVMEHIPSADTDAALDHMFTCAARIFFQIDTAPDCGGDLIGHDLHVTMRPHEEWRGILSRYGRVLFERHDGRQSIFYVERA